ncbi:MAG: CotH kinase family protein [Pseudomonadota bacterium]|nr:CotH kinase family protein [Pseudomonadota bacterium]
MVSLLALLLGAPPLRLEPRVQEPPATPLDGPGAFLYEEPGTIHDFEITLTDEAASLLGRGEPDVHATLGYRGVRLDVGLKLKGSSTFRGIDGKPSFKIDIGQWVDKQTLLGVRRLTLNNMITDPTMMREHAAYRLYEDVGVPAPRHAYARVKVNGEPYGLYGIVESMDERFLRRQFPGDSEGNLYDTHYTYADLTSSGVAYYALKEGHPLVPGEDLRDLVSELGSGNILDVIDKRFDRDALLGMWAVEFASSNWDSYVRNTNNYLLYHATGSDRWHFLPWGQDSAFRGGGSVYQGVVGRMATACLGDTQCKSLLDARVRSVVDTWEDGDLLGYMQETWALIGPECEDDQRKEAGCDPQAILSILADRPASVREDLP